MVAGGNPDCRDYLLRCDHVLPVGELPSAVWSHTVHRVSADGRMADPLLGLLLVVALPHELCIPLHHDSWRTGDGHGPAPDAQLDDHGSGWGWRLWPVVLPWQLDHLRSDPPAAGGRRRAALGSRLHGLPVCPYRHS